MKVAFINQDMFFRIGVASLIAVLKQKDHTCEIFLENGEENFYKSIENYSPDLIAISCTSKEHGWVLKTIKKLMELKIPFLLGGPHPTFFPEIIYEKDSINFICRGEGELAILELVNKLEKKQDITKIKNFWVRKGNKIYKNPVRNLIENLDDLPFADRDCYDKYKDIREDPTLHIYTSKGCIFNCYYCYNERNKKIYKGKKGYVRQRSPRKIIEEIELLIEKYPKANVVRFHDDLFIYNKAWVHDFLKLYKEKIKIPFICSVRADLLTEEIAKDLKASGCTRVSIGIECGNENYRKGVLNKYISNKQIVDCAKYLHKYGIRITTYNMIGLPLETIDNALETILLNHKIKPELAWASIFQPYPRTVLADYAVRKGILDKNYDVFNLGSYESDLSVLKQKNIKQLCNLHKFFWFLVKYPIFIPLAKLLIKLPETRFHHFFFNIPTLKRRIKYGDLGFFGNIHLILDRIWKMLILKRYAFEDK